MIKPLNKRRIQWGTQWPSGETIAFLPLTRGKSAQIDPADAKRVMTHAWTLIEDDLTSYARANIDGRPVFLHRFLLNPEFRQHVDHRNGNGLDNRRQNLRPCTPSQNHQNRRKARGCSSCFKGVSWNIQTQRWFASIRVNKKQKYLGRFLTEEAAARAYDQAALAAFGEFAWLNFPCQAMTDIPRTRSQATEAALKPWAGSQGQIIPPNN